MKYPWMPLFNGDLLANTLHLSAQEFGAYMLLIIHAWEFSAKVKVADAQRIARVDNRHWSKVRDTLAPFFDPRDGLRGSATEVVHPRVAKELANASELSNKRKDAALQMHEKRRASASILHMPLPSQSLKESSLELVKEAQPVQMHGPQTTGWRPRIDDDEARIPPRTKSDNVLQPIPDQLLADKRTAGEE